MFTCLFFFLPFLPLLRSAHCSFLMDPNLCPGDALGKTDALCFKLLLFSFNAPSAGLLKLVVICGFFGKNQDQKNIFKDYFFCSILLYDGHFFSIFSRYMYILWFKNYYVRIIFNIDTQKRRLFLSKIWLF